MKLLQKRRHMRLYAACLLSAGVTSVLPQQGAPEDKSRPPVVLCDVNPATVEPDGSATITAKGSSPQNRPLSYAFTATSGEVSSQGNSAVFKAIRVAPGPVIIKCTVTDDHGLIASDTARLNVTRGD